MIMKETDALTKWCPFTRVDYSESSINRSRIDGSPKEGTHCIGSKCMAWNTSGLGQGFGRCGLVDKD